MPLGNNIQNRAIPQNSTSISGELLFQWECSQHWLICYKSESMCCNVELWWAPNIRTTENTLPSRLYPVLFPIDNLRGAVTTANWVLIKEKIDWQKIGQSSTTPFLKMNDCNLSYEKSGKKGVTFDAMETLERQCDSIDRLASLVSKMNVKMDRKRPHTSLKSIKKT